jgi:hypothetical protein
VRDPTPLSQSAKRTPNGLFPLDLKALAESKNLNTKTRPKEPSPLPSEDELKLIWSSLESIVRWKLGPTNSNTCHQLWYAAQGNLQKILDWIPSLKEPVAAANGYGWVVSRGRAELSRVG